MKADTPSTCFMLADFGNSSDFFFFFLFCVCVFCQHCTLDLGSYIKDLSVVHDDLSSIVILDNSPGAYRSHPGKFSTLSFNVRVQGYTG